MFKYIILFLFSVSLNAFDSFRPLWEDDAPFIQRHIKSIYDYEENTTDPTDISYFYNDSKNIEDSFFRMKKIIELIRLRFDCYSEEDLSSQGYDLDVVLKLFEKEISGLKSHLNKKIIQ